jgi:XapX domain-containing protein
VKAYLVSLGVGVLVGVLYAVLNVRSPAPPMVALVGLLGILVGEQIPPLAQTTLERLASCAGVGPPNSASRFRQPACPPPRETH